MSAADATYASGNKDASPAVPDVFAITLPLGKSCDGLEMRVKTLGNTGKIVKSVDKHNNGKVFKITRSFIQIDATDALTSNSAQDKESITLAAGVGFSALTGVTTLVVNQPSGTCDAKTATDYTFPIYRTVTATQNGNTAGLTWTALKDPEDDGATPVANTFPTANCAYSLRRYVITLDSMPTASGTTAAKTLLYKSPVGSCNVAETTKGTFESYECSNRGACDGKSGLCACYEGYSGESCQTQTVLV